MNKSSVTRNDKTHYL